MNENLEENYQNKILSQEDLYKLFPFGKTKVQQLLISGQLPCVKIGRDYITTYSLIEKWIEENKGTVIYC